MEALHASLLPGAGYILLVVADNARAIAFYRRHGLVVRETIDAMPYYRAHMSVAIPSDAPPVSAHIMERHAP
jgi:ribosomal protein S18 acetylase RimI-like enzyme